MKRSMLPFVLLSLLVAVSACDDDPVQTGPSTLEITGASQRVEAGEPLPEPITIQLRRPNGSPAPSWPVTIRTIMGDLSITAGGNGLNGDDSQVSMTVQGTLELEVTMGPEPGLHTFSIEVPGILMDPPITIVGLIAEAPGSQ